MKIDKLAAALIAGAFLVATPAFAQSVVIAGNPEAFGNQSLGTSDAQVKDRRVTIVFTR